MTTDASQLFPPISPAMARTRFLREDELSESRFRENFNQFIIAPLAFAQPVIKLPVPPGRTSNHVLILLTGGTLALTVGQQAYTLQANELVAIPALQIFSLIDIPEDATGFLCFFSQETLLGAAGDTDPGFLKLTSNPLTPLPTPQLEFVVNIFNRLALEYSDNGAGRTDIIRPYLMALFAEINRVYIRTNPAKTDAGDRLVHRFMDLLTRNIREHRLVSQYADQLSVSPNHLNKVIKAQTGQSPSVWIDERIVLETKVLLFQSDLTVAQIAAEMGFGDQSAFGKLFRKYAHVSPTDFRSRITSPTAFPAT